MSEAENDALQLTVLLQTFLNATTLLSKADNVVEDLLTFEPLCYLVLRWGVVVFCVHIRMEVRKSHTRCHNTAL